jgi:hypothetical protein
MRRGKHCLAPLHERLGSIIGMLELNNPHLLFRALWSCSSSSTTLQSHRSAKDACVTQPPLDILTQTTTPVRSVPSPNSWLINDTASCLRRQAGFA